VRVRTKKHNPVTRMQFVQLANSSLIIIQVALH